MNKKLSFTLLLSFLLMYPSIAGKPTSVKHKVSKYPYLIYLPQQYNQEKKWPLIIYLHGRSACGNNLNKVRRYGLPFFADQGMNLDAIAVAPQCPAGKNWSADNWLDPMLHELYAKYNIDTTKIYLTGMSLGGFGTWDLAIKYPNRFAAIAPLCGGGSPQFVCALKNVPVWAFHGDKDRQVPFSRSEEMVEALRECGGNPKFSILKGFPHDIHRTYADENLYKWMLQFSLENRNHAENEFASTDTIVKDLPPVTKFLHSYAKNHTQKQVIQPQDVVQSQVKTTKDTDPSAVKNKIARNAQTDTIKGKDFMLVF